MKIRLRDHVRFDAAKMAKHALAHTARTLVDLYCLGPGQAQRPHVHDGQDKLYVVLEGRARITVGDADETLEAGEAVIAAAGTQHGVINEGPDAAVLLVVVTPPPPHA